MDWKSIDWTHLDTAKAGTIGAVAGGLFAALLPVANLTTAIHWGDVFVALGTGAIAAVSAALVVMKAKTK